MEETERRGTDIQIPGSPIALPGAKITPGLVKPMWGRLANPAFGNQRIKTAFFFAGQARDGSNRYGNMPVGANMWAYTAHPYDDRHLHWSDSRENRVLAVDQMIAAGMNVATVSTWGEDFLPGPNGWWNSAPMQCAPKAIDELFEAASGKRLLLMPLIESRGDWAFCDEFPQTAEGKVAPGTVSQIVNLVNRYLKNPQHPGWADQWARVYDRRGQARYAVTIIHASSNRLNPNEHSAFAQGFDRLAEEVAKATNGVQVGFFLDALPDKSNAPGKYRLTPEGASLAFRNFPSLLGIQCFVPELWVGAMGEEQRIAWKRDFSRRWFGTGIPFLMDVCTGYDNHLIFPKTALTYGYSQAWLRELKKMVAEFGAAGIAYNSWNGYTEGMAAVPTHERGDDALRWLQSLVL